jgi:hypothetical protein
MAVSTHPKQHWQKKAEKPRMKKTIGLNFPCILLEKLLDTLHV